MAEYLAVVILIILLVVVMYWVSQNMCMKCYKLHPCTCVKQTPIKKESYNAEPDRQFYKRIDATNKDLIKKGKTRDVVTDWGDYLTYTFLEPEVLQSQENYFSEAVGRLSNPGRFITTDGHTDGSSANYVGLAQPRRVDISPDAMLQPDVDMDNYRDPTGAESAVGRLATHWGYDM